MANSDAQGVTERVIPDNGRQETSWLLASIIIILSLAGLTLKLNQDTSVVEKQHLELNVTGKAVLTALRNAADEIQFMAESPDALPAVSELIELALPPFADNTGTFSQYQWLQPQNNCYVGQPATNNNPQFVLKFSQNHADIFWRDFSSTSVDCNQLSAWQTAPHHD